MRRSSISDFELITNVKEKRGSQYIDIAPVFALYFAQYESRWRGCHFEGPVKRMKPTYNVTFQNGTLFSGTTTNVTKVRPSLHLKITHEGPSGE
jgi:hypothetical protein